MYTIYWTPLDGSAKALSVEQIRSYRPESIYDDLFVAALILVLTAALFEYLFRRLERTRS